MSSTQKHPKIVVILGPTASGKSALAVKLARKFHGEIISADSRQVYRGLNIGSGKVPRDNLKFKNQKSKLHIKIQNYPDGYYYKGIRHHLIDVVSPNRKFTVVQYQKAGQKIINELFAAGHLPIICGGTGLYIDALLHNWQFPKVKPNLKLRRALENKSAEKLFARIQKLDPGRAANIDPKNKRRLVRALEIVTQTGRPVPPLATHNYPQVLEGLRMGSVSVLKIGIKPEGQELKAKIRKRLLTRLRQGMVGEIKKLRREGLGWKRLDELGLEYRYISRYLRGLMSYEEMTKKLETEIWRYAKRQMTWWRRDKEIIWCKNNGEAKIGTNAFLLNQPPRSKEIFKRNPSSSRFSGTHSGLF